MVRSIHRRLERLEARFQRASDPISFAIEFIHPEKGLTSTLLTAAGVTERVCYGLELDPKYADVVVERWQGLSGKKATLEGDGRTFDSVRQDRLRRAA